MVPKIAVVTGASRGIGLAIATALAELGTSLCLCARSAGPLEEAAGYLGKRTRVTSCVADVSRADHIAELFARCRRDLGPVDWLVNNAALFEDGSLGELTEAQWDRTMDANLKGPFLCTQAALPDLIARKGRVVNLGSISGTLGTPRRFAYNASKWGLNGLTVSWAAELKPAGVLVAAVLPGSVDTEMLRQSGFPPDMQPEDIAGIVRYLLAEAPFAMTGSLVNAFG